MTMLPNANERTYSTSELARAAGVPYSRVVLLLREHGEEVPELERRAGRRRFPHGAIEAVKRLWAEYNLPAKLHKTEQALDYEAAVKRLKAAAKALRQVEREIATLVHWLAKNPPTAASELRTLPGGRYRLRTPISVLVTPRGGGYLATFVEADLEARGGTPQVALSRLRGVILSTYTKLRETEAEAPEPEQVEVLRVLAAFLAPVEPKGGEGDLAEGDEELGRPER